jgi:uroporphyrinogen decarboxylase
MNSRERFLTAIKKEEPDRPPLFATLTPQMAKKLSDFLGLRYEDPLDSLLASRISHMELLLHLGNDMVGVAACSPDSHPTEIYENGITKNEWGMVFKNSGLYNEFHEFPLGDALTEEQINQYPWPDALGPGRFRNAEITIKRYKNDFGIIGDLETSIFETSWYLAGLEKILLDLLSEPPYLNKLLDKILEINLSTGIELIRRGADLIWAGDDFGGQQGMLIDPDLWRHHFKPRIREMFENFRKANPEIKIAWHSCGSIVPIIPDFIELGLDILNPIQPEAKGMDPVFLKKEFGRDLVFFGGISVQDLLPNGSPGQIRNEVRRIASILGNGGGYIIAPAHNIQADTPVENAMAFFEAVKEL